MKQKDRILFWLDPNLVYFKLAKYLQDKYDSDLFAIIDVNSQRTFFDSQNFVKFKQKWYLRDFLNVDQEKPNLEYLSKMEIKYQLNIWNIIHSDPIFNEYNSFKTFSFDEVLSIIEQLIHFYEGVLEEVKPNFLVMRGLDYSTLQILLQMCKKKGIKVLFCTETRLGYRSTISSDKEFLDDFNPKSLPLTDFTLENLRAQKNAFAEQLKKFRKEYRSSYTKKFEAIIQFLIISSKSSYQKYYANLGRSPLRVIINEINFMFKNKIRENFFRKHAQSNILSKKKFVYFPLHYQPERTTLISAPYFTNQLYVIKNIARSLPVDYELYVKEHPTQEKMGWREKSFYKTIAELPNTKLLAPNVSNDELMSGCSFIVTITGSSAFEGSFFGKPSIMFAETSFSTLSWIYLIKKLDELPKIIQKCLETKVDYSELNQFVNALMKHTFEFDLTSFTTSMLHDFYYDGFLRDRKLSHTDIENYLSENTPDFQNLADEFIKKIISEKGH